MRRVYFLQPWYALADEALEDALYDGQAMRAFVGGDLVPDAATLLQFRHRLEEHALTRALFAEVNAPLGERGQLLREGTIVDATILAAAPSTRNKPSRATPRCTRRRTATSGTLAGRRTWAWTWTAVWSTRWWAPPPTWRMSPRRTRPSTARRRSALATRATRGGASRRGGRSFPRGALVRGGQARQIQSHGRGQTQGSHPGVGEGQGAGACLRRTPLSTGSKTSSNTARPAPGAWPRTPPNSTRSLPWPTWCWPGVPCGQKSRHEQLKPPGTFSRDWRRR